MKHPQAEVLIAIANGEDVQCQNGKGEWYDCSPNTALRWLGDEFPVRIKPKTININGHEVPEPVREPLEKGQEYWVLELTNKERCCRLVWRNDHMDNRILERGLIHLSEEAALAHARALLSLTEVKK